MSWINTKDSSVSRGYTRTSTQSTRRYSEILRPKEVKPQTLLIIAIDFGTTNTGFAFSFEHDPEKILTTTYGGELPEDRVPTVVLLNPDETLHSFGYKAMENYGKFNKDKRSKYYYIEYFKMALHKIPKITRNSTIPDILNRKVSAMNVFAMVIGYFKGIALKVTKDMRKNLKEEHVLWMITIPAIWTDSARQFMSEAAVQAGIKKENLRLVLEPEAASLFCRRQDIMTSQSDLQPFPEGHKYILADLGGGTADICVHEILKVDKLKELYKATGGHLGGNLVNEAFEQFLKNLVGEKIWDDFKQGSMDMYFELLNNFEMKKKNFSGTEDVLIKAQAVFIELVNEHTEKSLQEIITAKSKDDLINFIPETGRIVLKKELMQSFFDPSVSGIVAKLKEIIESCADPNVQTLMLVGGYAESPYLREKIKSTFKDPELKIILEQDPRLAVLKGAVMMGYQSKTFVDHVAQYTYGIEMRDPFQEGIHPQSLRRRIDGDDVCIRIFHKIIEKGQILRYDDPFTWNVFDTARDPALKNENKATGVWRSTKASPSYCGEDDDCSLVGYIVEKPPPEGWPDFLHIVLFLEVGETEFTVRSYHVETGHVYQADMDFLPS